MFLSAAQNINRELLFAQSLKAKIGQTFKQTRAAEKRIKRLSSTLSSTSETVDSELLKHISAFNVIYSHKLPIIEFLILL